jgi:hypothetical protein
VEKDGLDDASNFYSSNQEKLKRYVGITGFGRLNTTHL